MNINIMFSIIFSQFIFGQIFVNKIFGSGKQETFCIVRHYVLSFLPKNKKTIIDNIGR